MNNHFLFTDTAFMDQPGEAAAATRAAARVYPIHVAMSGSRAMALRVAAASTARAVFPRPAAHLLAMGVSSLVVLPAAVMALVVAMGPGLL